MTLLSSLTSEHDELQDIITAVWSFAAAGGLNAIERDDGSVRTLRTLAEGKSAIDQVAMNAISEPPLTNLEEAEAELGGFKKKNPKASRSKLGNFAVTVIIRAAFWQKQTGELLWMLGLKPVDESLKTQLVQYHAKIIDNLAKDNARIKD